MTKHNRFSIWHPREYSSWCQMINRCNNQNADRYADYGGRGITVCSAWVESFTRFLDDMGKRPKYKSLERRNNEGGYNPDNCYWANAREQANNRRSNRVLTFNGVSKTLQQWARLLNVTDSCLRRRLDKGYPLSVVLYNGHVGMPARTYVEIEGVTMSLEEAAEYMGISYDAVKSRLYRGTLIKVIGPHGSSR